MFNPGKLIASGVVLVGLGFAIWRLMPTEESGPGLRRGFGGAGETPVVVEEVVLKPQVTRIDTVGTSRAIQSATIFPAVGGEVVSVNFSAGDFVDEGTILIQLDDREEKLALDLAEVRVRDTLRTLDRRRELSKRGTVTAASFDEAERLYEEALIARDQARLAFDDRSVKAPFSGYVGATDVNVGDRITTSTAITTLDDRRRLLVRFNVPEQFVDVIAVNREVQVEARAVRNRTSVAEISEIGSQVDPVSRTFPVRATLENADDTYRPGQSFRVRVDLKGRLYPAIPEVALQWGATGAYVWAVREGKAARVSATIVDRILGEVLIRAELEEGDFIVVEGVQRMRPGSPVKAINEPGETSNRLSRVPTETAR